MENIPFLFEDDDLAVISKPPGVVVNRAQTVTTETIEDWWRQKCATSSSTLTNKNSWTKLIPSDFSDEYGSAEDIFAERGGIVHRLDKETSGILVLAKNPGALVHLLQQFRQRQVQKTYTCLAHGKFHIAVDTIHLPLGRSTQNRTKFAVDSEGRVAETHYQVQKFFSALDLEKLMKDVKEGMTEVSQPHLKNVRKRFSTAYQGFSLVRCQPKTGRTHQIRVHLAHLRHPLVGDTTYLGKKRANLDLLWCPRLFLHASEIELNHPRTQQTLHVQAPLWPDLQAALTYVSS